MVSRRNSWSPQRDQVVEVLHDRRTLVGRVAHPRDGVRVERIGAPAPDLVRQHQVGDRAHVALRGGLRRGDLEERTRAPEPPWRRLARPVGRVEDPVQPALGLLEALVDHQAVGDQQRCVEEQLPVVARVGAVVGEVDVVHGERRPQRRPGPVLRDQVGSWRGLDRAGVEAVQPAASQRPREVAHSRMAEGERLEAVDHLAGHPGRGFA